MSDKTHLTWMSYKEGKRLCKTFHNAKVRALLLRNNKKEITAFLEGMQIRIK